MSHDHEPNVRSSHRPARLALSIPDSGASGLIDARALRAEPVALSLSPSRPSAVGPPRAAVPPLRAAWAAIATATAASALLIAVALAVDPAPTVVVQQVPASSRQLALHDRVPDEGELATHAEPPRRVTRSTSATASVDAPEPEVTAPSEAVPAVRTDEPKPTPTAPRSRTTKVTKTQTATKTETPRSLPVECVLDPSQCDASVQPTASAPVASTAKPRPEKLSALQLKQALATTKADARRCGPEHGADPGTSVQVKLSIEGPTGSVVSAVALGDQAGTSLGKCVAAALSRTDFPEFSAARMGTLYTVRI